MLFEAPHTTYVIVIPALNKRQWHPSGVLLEDKVYIGSTTKSIHSRQDARVRKLRLLQEGQFTNTEVMVHYFHTRSDFFHALILPGFCLYRLLTARQQCELPSVCLYISGSLNSTCLGLLN